MEPGRIDHLDMGLTHFFAQSTHLGLGLGLVTISNTRRVFGIGMKIGDKSEFQV